MSLSSLCTGTLYAVGRRYTAPLPGRCLYISRRAHRRRWASATSLLLHASSSESIRSARGIGRP